MSSVPARQPATVRGGVPIGSDAVIIFLPVRNGGHYLRQAIDSIVAQTRPGWQLVVLENGSTDDTVATVRQYDDERITLVVAAESLGIVENWRRGFDYLRDHVADDPLVTFIGHDDYFFPDYVAQIEALAASAPDATLYQTPFDLVDSDGRLIRPCRPIPERESWVDLASALCWGMRDSFGTGYAFRARDYLRVGGIPDLPLLLGSDWLLFVRLAKLGYKHTSLRAGCAYRLHGASTSSLNSAVKVNAALEGLYGFAAGIAELDDFWSTQAGAAALASLLARELGTYNLPNIGRVLDAANLVRRDELAAMLAGVSRGLPATTWATPVEGRFDRATRRLRTFARNRSFRGLSPG